MKNREGVRYAFAKAADGSVVSALDVERSRGPFACTGCGDVVGLVRGEVRAPHFRHVAAKCSPETYLHVTGKRLILDGFNAAKAAGRPYWLRRPQVVRCNVGRELVPGVECDRLGFVDRDLCELYSFGTEEKRIGGFVADVLLEGRGGKLAIEVAVTHPCSAEKKASGLRIVEVVIASDDDLIPLSEGLGLTGPVVLEFNRLDEPAVMSESCEGCTRRVCVSVVDGEGVERHADDVLLCDAKVMKASNPAFFALCGKGRGQETAFRASLSGKFTLRYCFACKHARQLPSAYNWNVMQWEEVPLLGSVAVKCDARQRMFPSKEALTCPQFLPRGVWRKF